MISLSPLSASSPWTRYRLTSRDLVLSPRILLITTSTHLPSPDRVSIASALLIVKKTEKKKTLIIISFVNRSFVRITTCKNFDMKNTDRDSFYRWAINCLHLNISEKHPGYRWAETGDISNSTRSVWQSHVFHLSAHSPGDHDATVLEGLSA